MKTLALLLGKIFLLVFLTFCSEKNIDEISKLRVIYLPEHTDVMVPVTCESINHMLDFRKSKVISDKTFLTPFTREIVELNSVDGTNSIEVRIKVLIDYPHKTDTLCLGEYFSTVLNGELMEDNPKLLDLIKSEIY